MNSIAATFSSANLRRLAPGLLLMAAVLLLFRETAVAMVAIWIRSETFAHAFLVPPIVVWLVWRRRETLRTLTPKPMPWVLLPIAAVCAFWLVGELASVNAATQFSLVALIVLSVPAVFGLAVTRALTFPLLYLFFAVPVGEFMVPFMMEWTADFTVAALQFSGVPVYREGLQFIIPSGNWSVVEACSGVRYLIASFMVGTLYAYLNYQSMRKRLLFIAASLLMPILANWFRAYLIVMLGHLSGNKLAAGVDHIIYGWVFFGIVIGVMFWIGGRWAEPDAPVPQPVPGPAARAASGAPRVDAAWWVGGAMAALLLLTQATFWRLDRVVDSAAPALALPAPAEGWAPADTPLSDWVPAFKNASAQASATYRQGSDRVAVWVSYYRDQNYERKLVTSTNGMVDLEAEKATWSQTAAGGTVATVGGRSVALRTGNLRGSAHAGADGQRLRVWQLYWVGGQLFTSDARARLHIALNRLFGRGDDGAVIFFYADTAGIDDAAADALLGRFVGPNLPPLLSALERVREARPAP